MSAPADPNVFAPPTVDDVGALLRARTQDTHDDELGTFTADTRPTAEQAEAIIVQASSAVLARTGKLDDNLKCGSADDIRTNAKYMITLLAAMLIELSYFPEQVNSDRSPYGQYRDLYNDGMTALLDAVKECIDGEVVPDDGGSYGPSFSFPVDAGGMVGWQTRW